LKRSPNHPGANHYYIHVMEPSPFADLALPSADRLGKLTPGLSHTVHMPSHIYLRTGNYKAGISVNVEAIKQFQAVTKLYAPVTENSFLYSIHNQHMLVNHAMVAGRSKEALEGSLTLQGMVPREYLETADAMANYLQYLDMTHVLANVRFAKWKELLKMQSPPENLVNASVLYHWGKGMAYAFTSEFTSAKQEAAKIKMLMKDSVLFKPFQPFSPAIDGAIIALNLLEGSIAMQEKNLTAAIGFYKKAVETETQMVYNEPRDWMLNPAHYLGQAYLLNNQKDLARETYLIDLQNNSNNVWALTGLYNATNGTAQQKAVVDKLKNAKKDADVLMTASILY